jgi:serine/threonine protein kinase
MNRTATLAIKSYLHEYDGDSSALLNADDLVLGELINAGAEGQVFRATYAGAPVAVKEIHNQHYELSESFKREFQALRLIQHPGIIRLYGVVAMQSAVSGRNRFLLVMEVAKGSLRDVIDKAMADGTQLRLSKVLAYAIEIAQAMAYIHAQDFLHLDVSIDRCS